MARSSAEMPARPELNGVGWEHHVHRSAHRCGRVEIRPPREEDKAPLMAAVRRSAQHIAPWNHVPDEDNDFWDMLAKSELNTEPVFLVINRADGGIAGKITVYNILRGSSQTATVGYDAYLPYAGTGRMTEALRLVVDQCFLAAEGLELHRLEINIAPDNIRSVALAHRLGFRREGISPRFQRLNGAWRGCVRLALTAEEWTPLECCDAGPFRRWVSPTPYSAGRT
ncbi:GNAT family N-acetyltransferase [Amycolatopsis sp. H20-H5]|uniref:GNAT family N-acetyltransferase n=1 Tax=Amycolatopsis sp. H20-H5 TaxID=3046309 RepID=UPI002DB58387|nr:GNAT family protein [Amycolatopsis sp. H20-H5]MEC3973778.1 GNAT family protein [Amycolatopsis sp. H20-H5]